MESGVPAEPRASEPKQRRHSGLPAPHPRSGLWGIDPRLESPAIRVFDPGFFFGEVFGTLEICPGPEPDESEGLEFLHQFRDGGSDRRMRLAFHGQSFVHDPRLVTRRRAIDENSPVEVAVAWIDALHLMFLDQSVSFKQ